MPVTMRPLRLSPTRAELMFVTEGEGELRGRVTGPRCRHATTLEVTLPLKPIAAERPGYAAAEVVIPEPCWWDAESPFLYTAVAETDSASAETLSFGIRSVQFGPTGLRWNGRLLELKGGTRDRSADETDVTAIRAAGGNLLVVPADADPSIWEAADEIGVYVLGLIDAAKPPLRELARHACCLGWLTDGESVTVPGGLLPLTGRVLESTADRLTFDLGDGRTRMARRGWPTGSTDVSGD